MPRKYKPGQVSKFALIYVRYAAALIYDVYLGFLLTVVLLIRAEPNSLSRVSIYLAVYYNSLSVRLGEEVELLIVRLEHAGVKKT